MQGKGGKSIKKLAETPRYVSPHQLTLAGFETPFDQKLNKENRWVKLAQAIPWDKIVPLYDKLFRSAEGRPPLSGRLVIGAMIIKHMESLTDRAAIEHITENMYMQYFLGYSSFTIEAPFTAPLFVSIRKRMTLELTGQINEIIINHCQPQEEEPPEPPPPAAPTKIGNNQSHGAENTLTAAQPEKARPELPSHKGKLLMDATVAPQAITFPTDLKLLNAARIKSEQLIDLLYKAERHGAVKPRTYRKVARKQFLNTAKKKAKSAREIYKANGRQLRFLKRNLQHIDQLIAAYDHFPLKPRAQKYLLVLHTVYDQQQLMHQNRIHRVDNRIVNIHQPHIRPIVRGKDKAKAEFGSKLQVSLTGDGFTLIDKLSWEAFNEGEHLAQSVKQYKARLGYYPKEVLADKIYCTRKNRQWLSGEGIKLSAKPLGRPSAKAVANHVRPGDRNPIEGKFGQAKLAYGMDSVKARLKTTSESWIACIILVLNLVNMTRRALLSLIYNLMFQQNLTTSNNYFYLSIPK